MALLYPPYIEGKLPAQVGDVLNIPYQLNRAIGAADLVDMDISARIRTVSTGAQIGDILTTKFSAVNDNGIYTATFNLDGISLRIGQYYKIQLTFGNNNPYSTVGVFKYTKQPTIYIEGLSTHGVNNAIKSYIGVYKSLDDPSEKVIEYKFDIYKNNMLLESTDWTLHNIEKNTEINTSTDIYALQYELEAKEYYYVQYSVRTNNGLELSTPKYYLRTMATIPLKIPNCNFIAKPNYEEGTVIVGLQFKDSYQLGGVFNIYRSQKNKWELMKTITINKLCSKNEFLALFEDQYIESGIQYNYGIQQINEGLTTQILSIHEPVSVSFDDMFLSDLSFNYKIKYDPAISNFKTTLLESKIDTLGGQYPFFFRNGRVNYKEFPISGLITCIDEENSSIRTYTPGDKEETSFVTNLTSDNFLREKDYKLKILDWLNNGKPKIFRSAAEGNYLVRLMNISLSPKKELGRMIHSFSATAYEIDAINNNTLKHYNLLNNISDTVDIMNIEQLKLQNNNGNYGLEYSFVNPIYYLNFNNLKYGTEIRFKTSDQKWTNIKMGLSGHYKVYIDKENPILEIFIPYTSDSDNSEGYIEYGYFQSNFHIMDENNQKITSVEYTEHIEQWNTNPNKTSDWWKFTETMYLRLQIKDIEQVTLLPSDEELIQQANNTIIYYSPTEGKYKYFDFILNRWLITDKIDTSYTIKLQNQSEEIINQLTSGRIEWKNLKIESLTYGNGIYADVFYGHYIYNN